MKTIEEVLLNPVTSRFLHDEAIVQIIKDAKKNGRTLNEKSITHIVYDRFSQGRKEIMERYTEYMTIGAKAMIEAMDEAA